MSCVMIPEFETAGDLPPGIHWTTWQEFVERFGTTPYRLKLIAGLKAAVDSLRAAGCRTVYIGGSFVTAKEVPNDFDACWDIDGVNPDLLDPILLKFDDGRFAQRTKFSGELFPAQTQESGSGQTFLEFFQTDKETGDPKGIVALDLRSLEL